MNRLRSRSGRDFIAIGVAIAGGSLILLPEVRLWAEAVRILVPVIAAGFVSGALSAASVDLSMIAAGHRLRVGGSVGLRAGLISALVVGGLLLLGTAWLVAESPIAIAVRTLISVGYSTIPGVAAGVISGMIVISLRRGSSSLEMESAESRAPEAPPKLLANPGFYAGLVVVLCYLLTPVAVIVNSSSGIGSAAPEQLGSVESDSGHPDHEPQEEGSNPDLPKEPFYVLPDGFSEASASMIMIAKTLDLEAVFSTANMAISPDHRLLAYLSASEKLVILDLNENVKVAQFKRPATQTSFAWSGDSKRVFFSSVGRETGIVDLAENRLIPFPLPEAVQVPESKPVWWSDDEIVFVGDDFVLDLESLRLVPLEKSKHWSELDSKARLEWNEHDRVPREDVNWEIVVESVFKLGEPSQFVKAIPAERRIGVRSHTTPATWYLPEIEIGARAAVYHSAATGGKIVTQEGSLATVLYLGLRKKQQEQFDARVGDG